MLGIQNGDYWDNTRDMEATPTPGPERRDERSPRTTGTNRSPHWLTRKHAAVSGGLGTVMLVLAVVAPLVAPVEQRAEVLIITVLFGLAGALMLYAAVDTNRHIQAVVPRAIPVSFRKETPNRAAARAMLLQQQIRNSRNRKVAGFVFGLFFGLAGMIAPFVLSEGNDNPDARFLMIIGFSPVAISGALMVMLFGQTLWAVSSSKLGASAGKTAVLMTDQMSETIASSMATVAIASGLLLSACAVILPLIITSSMRNGIGVPAAVMGGLGMALSLLGASLVKRGQPRTSQKADVTPAVPKPRRAPVPRIPSNMLYRIVVPVAILLMLILTIAVILIVVAATVTPLVP